MKNSRGVSALMILTGKEFFGVEKIAGNRIACYLFWENYPM